MSESTDNAAAQTAATDDWLGYGAYADALWARVVKALDKDNASGKPLGDDPLVVGLFGEWGAGKSQLLKLIYERAQQQSARDIAERVFAAPSKLPVTITVPVMFQPWKYEHEEHLHVPIAAHVRDALDEAWKQLPTDFEQVKKLALQLADKVEDVDKTITKAKRAFTTLKSGLSGAKAAVESNVGGFVAASVDTLLAVGGVPPMLSGMRSAMMKRDLAGEDEASDEAADGKDAGEPVGGKSKPKTQAAAAAKRPTKAEKATAALAHTADGFGFYRVDKFLRAMTRPTRNKKLLDASGMSIGPEIEFDLHINFVVFVDDLDRCLPEKAVQMLELIKTVFNVESFAFVLALDDEVIERGISHRYQAYQLAGKKPEMPITGFEYLEKIVHVPFRLPALTRRQAELFIQRYEAESIEAEASERWFTELASTTSEKNVRLIKRADVLDLALSGFDVYMPRKLVRLAELVHQISDVAKRRAKPISFDAGSAIDVRVVLAVALVQLFQPELYRILRRRQDCFPFLLAAFAERSTLGVVGEQRPINSDPPDLREANLSSIDLWRWAVRPKLDKSKPWEPASSESAYQYAVNFIAKEHADDGNERANAQLVRLPLVVQILDHRAAQRHLFDVLKLTKALATQMDATDSAPHALTFAPYLSLLAMEPEIFGKVHATLGPVTAGSGVAASANLEVSPRITSADIRKIADDLLSPETAAQANLVSRNSLEAGRVLTDQLATRLVEELHVRLEALRLPDDEETSDHIAAQRRLLAGLQFLAPYLTPADAREHWNLVKDCVDFDKPIEPKLRALWGDVRSALGCDDRFDPNNFYLLKDRFEDHDERIEPIPGFVLVPADKFVMGHAAEKDHQPHKANIAAPFYISRTLVTVDQFALFLQGEDAPYDNKDYWDVASAAWRKEHPTLSRIDELGWSAQRRYGSRPVFSVSWFEARAYARWLNAQLRPALDRLDASGVSGKYEVTLPTETEWERAAGAASLTSADGRRWPWVGDDSDIDQRANVKLLVGCASAVGLYPPNPIGLHDMAGNVREWTDNVGEPGLVKRVLGDAKKVHLLSLRGGSGADSPAHASCSFRLWNVPDGWGEATGFRVMLSLAEIEC